MKNSLTNYAEILKYGIVAGALAGILSSLVAFAFNPILPSEFMKLNEKIRPTLAARFLYGGITEEILLRFGLMTFVVWISFRVFDQAKPIVYWIGILLVAIIFAFAHFPIAYQAVDTPSSLLLAYILIGNSFGGIIFGWVYWKKGLESAFVAHIVTHVVLVLAAPILG